MAHEFALLLPQSHYYTVTQCSIVCLAALHRGIGLDLVVEGVIKEGEAGSAREALVSHAAVAAGVCVASVVEAVCALKLVQLILPLTCAVSADDACITGAIVAAARALGCGLGGQWAPPQPWLTWGRQRFEHVLGLLLLAGGVQLVDLLAEKVESEGLVRAASAVVWPQGAESFSAEWLTISSAWQGHR